MCPKLMEVYQSVRIIIGELEEIHKYCCEMVKEKGSQKFRYSDTRNQRFIVVSDVLYYLSVFPLTHTSRILSISSLIENKRSGPHPHTFSSFLSV